MVLFPFGDDAVVHPGHGPATTVGRERRTNPFLVED
jgi:glyoxylase-like metal-dependent hydrolase (beta-lactamase superfamily II)